MQDAEFPAYLVSLNRTTLHRNLKIMNRLLASLLPAEEVQHFNVPKLTRKVTTLTNLPPFTFR